MSNNEIEIDTMMSCDLKIDDLIGILNQVKEIHGNINVGYIRLKDASNHIYTYLEPDYEEKSLGMHD